MKFINKLNIYLFYFNLHINNISNSVILIIFENGFNQNQAVEANQNQAVFKKIKLNWTIN